MMQQEITGKAQLKTGTTTLAIMCKDGIVMAADKRATAGRILFDSKVKKVFPINDRMAITIAGTVSEIQLMVKLIRAEIALKDYHVHREATTKEVAHLVGGMLYQNIRKFSTVPGVAAFLLGGYDVDDGFSIFELSPDGVITKIDDYVADGSGFVFALGVLDTLWKKNMTMEQGMDLSIKAVNAALQRDTASGNGINIVAITKEGAKEVLEKRINIGLL